MSPCLDIGIGMAYLPADRAGPAPRSRSTSAAGSGAAVATHAPVHQGERWLTRATRTRTRSSSATRSATPSCAGARRRSRASRPCRRTPASCTRSTWSTSRASSSTTSDVLYPDTLVGTDSHTTMINGLGVLGWGVGGIEAEAAMLGQPMSMLVPRVVGFKLSRRAARGRHGDRPRAHRHADAARARRGGQVRRVLRAGRPEPAAGRPGHDRQHVAGVRLDLRDLPDRRGDPALPRVLRPRAEHIELVEAYARAQGLWHDEHSEEPTYSETLELDLGDVVPSLAGPKRPQDRVSLTESKASFRMALTASCPSRTARRGPVEETLPGQRPAGAAGAAAPAESHGEAAGAGTGGVQVADRAPPPRRSRWPTARRPSSTTATW